MSDLTKEITDALGWADDDNWSHVSDNTPSWLWRLIHEVEDLERKLEAQEELAMLDRRAEGGQ